MSHLAEVIDRLISQDEHAEDRALVHELELSGDTGFELVRSQLQARRGVHAARTLRLLLLITRHTCAHRLPEVVEAALEHVSSKDIALRSAAASVAMSATRVLSVWRPRRRFVVNPRPRAEVEAAVARALEEGLDEVATESAERFLATDRPKRYARQQIRTADGDGTLYVEYTSELPTREVRVVAEDRRRSDDSRERGFTELVVDILDVSPSDFITEAEFEQRWLEADPQRVR